MKPHIVFVKEEGMYVWAGIVYAEDDFDPHALDGPPKMGGKIRQIVRFVYDESVSVEGSDKNRTVRYPEDPAGGYMEFVDTYVRHLIAQKDPERIRADGVCQTIIDELLKHTDKRTLANRLLFEAELVEYSSNTAILDGQVYIDYPENIELIDEELSTLDPVVVVL